MFVTPQQPLTRADFVRMAEEVMKERKCRWSEACLEIKRRYPESREAFGVPVFKQRS